MLGKLYEHLDPTRIVLSPESCHLDFPTGICINYFSLLPVKLHQGREYSLIFCMDVLQADIIST
jgi:hypothetical protein